MISFKSINRTFLLAVIVFCFAYFKACAQFQRSYLWHDEFKGTGLVSDIWEMSKTVKGERLSSFCPNIDNVYLGNGKLHLRLIKTDDDKKTYRSGRVVTKEKFHFRKGRLVVRAKIPKVFPGAWYAIWLSGIDIDSGYHAELDLMENKATMTKNSYNANYHLWGHFRNLDNNHVQHPKNVKVNVTKWQKYTLEVTDDRICMKVGRHIVYDIHKGDYGPEWPQDQDYSLRLAFAYGGWAAKGCGTDDSELPAEFLIDYVRFYPLK